MSQGNPCADSVAGTLLAVADAMDLHLSERSRVFARVAPQPGAFHTWLLSAANRLRRDLDVASCFRLLRRFADAWVRPVSDREIADAIAKAFHTGPAGFAPAGRRWPSANAKAIRAVVRNARALFTLAPLPLTAADVLPSLFRMDDLVCVARSKMCPCIQPLRAILPAADALQFVVASPMRGAAGLNKAGRVSVRCTSNTGPRTHLVVENDTAPKDAQCKLLSHLASILPLRLAVDSGGKSVHGFYACAGLPEDEVRAFFAYAVRLGADPATWQICQFVRLPGGTRYRDDGTTTRQAILYFDPAQGRGRP